MVKPRNRLDPTPLQVARSSLRVNTLRAIIHKKRRSRSKILPARINVILFNIT